MSESKTLQRDFVDFLIGLYDFKRIFFLILIVVLSLGLYFDHNFNTSHKFTLNARIEDKSALQNIINYIVQVESANFDYSISDKVQVQNIPDRLDYDNFRTDLCELMRSSFNDYKFFDNMANVYSKGLDTNELDLKQTSDILKQMVSVKSLDGTCSSIKVSGDLDKINFFKNNLVFLLNSYISNEINSRLVILSNFNKELSKRKALESQSNSLVIFEKLPDTEINFLKHNASNVSKNMGSMFIYIFCIFLSFLIHVIYVLFLDLIFQVQARRK